MVRRWIIRGFFVALCVLFAGAWLGSYWRAVEIEYQGKLWNRLLLQGGRVALIQEDERAPFSISQRWQITFDGYYDPDHWSNSDKDAKHHMLGFLYSSYYDIFPGRMSFRVITVPFWFITLLSGVLLVLAWRKTRGKWGGKAFPVEVRAEDPDQGEKEDRNVL